MRAAYAGRAWRNRRGKAFIGYYVHFSLQGAKHQSWASPSGVCSTASPDVTISEPFPERREGSRLAETGRGLPCGGMRPCAFSISAGARGIFGRPGRKRRAARPGIARSDRRFLAAHAEGGQTEIRCGCAVGPSLPGPMDALRPCFKDGVFDAGLCAYGMRNLDSLDGGIDAIGRLLKPGGIFITLEFFRPTTVFTRFFYHGLAPLCIPFLGWFFSSRRQAYAYLVDSIRRFRSVGEYRDGFRDMASATWRSSLAISGSRISLRR